jgi:hypothetical protein
MIHAQDSKVVSLITPQSVATNATASATASVQGYDYAEVTLHLATQTAGNTDTLVRLSESDGTTYATATDLNVTTIAPDTSNAQTYQWLIDLKARKKNLKIEYTPSGTARIASATMRLSRAEQAPVNATGRGVTVSTVA